MLAITRPSIETFGENVGTLTNEVFGLEVRDSGFYSLINKIIRNNNNYQDIKQQFDDQLGLEAKAIIRSLLINKKDEE
jgi:hypothetical protein